MYKVYLLKLSCVAISIIGLVYMYHIVPAILIASSIFRYAPSHTISFCISLLY